MDTNSYQIKIIEKNKCGLDVNTYLRGNLMGKGDEIWYEFTNLKTQKLMAAQIIPKSRLFSKRARLVLKNRINIHKRLNHKNVQKFETIFEDSENVYYLVEHQPFQSLFHLLWRRGRLTEPEVQYFLLQMVAALKYVHSQRVIHKDVKLEGFRLSEQMQIKLADFQLAVQLETDDERDFDCCSTHNYLAPEMLSPGSRYSYEVDIWSLGVCIYALLFGKPAFETSDVRKMYTKIRNCDYNFPKDVKISEPARDLITRILNKDPHRRPTLDEILNSSFLNPEGTIPQSFSKSILTNPPIIYPYQKKYNQKKLKNQKKNLEKLKKTPEELNSDFKEAITNSPLSESSLISLPSPSLINQLELQKADQKSQETKDSFPLQDKQFESEKTQKISKDKISNQQQQFILTSRPSTSVIRQLEPQNIQKSSQVFKNDIKVTIPKYLPQSTQTYTLFQFLNYFNLTIKN